MSPGDRRRIALTARGRSLQKEGSAILNVIAIIVRPSGAVSLKPC
jgi:hypothetical protein